MASLAALNQRIAAAGILDDGRVITGRPLTIAAAFAAEQPAMGPLPDEPFRVVANIPFAHTSDLLHCLLDEPTLPLVRADLIVEWGVAVKRGLPAPSSVSGILWGAFHELRVERKLPASAFDPPPACDAGVLVATRRARPLIPAAELPAYRRFVADAFRRGRCIGGALPRDLDAHQWAERYRRRA